MKHFGSVAKMKEATVEEIQAAKVPRPIAEEIFKKLRE